MDTNNKLIKKAANGVSASIVILSCLIIAICFYKFILGNPANFMDNNPANHPLPGNYFGTIYKGGFVVPIVITLFLTVLTLSIERLIAISKSKGKGNLFGFVQTIKKQLEAGNIEEARQLCNTQRGSVANVVNAALLRYADVEKNPEQTK